MAKGLLGPVGGIIAILGVIVLPITSGDTALRSCRLMVADYLHIDQKEKKNRVLVTLGIFVPVIFILVFAKMNAEGLIFCGDILHGAIRPLVYLLSRRSRYI